MKHQILRSLAALLVWTAVSSRSEGSEKEYLNRSIYVPVTFLVCQHLGNAVYYENDQAVSTMPVSRTFQFTYYANLKRLLPVAVPVRVEGEYWDDGEPFIARVAVTAEGFVTANGRRPIDIEKNLKTLRYKRDVRNAPVALRLECERVCARRVEDDPEDGVAVTAGEASSAAVDGSEGN